MKLYIFHILRVPGVCDEVNVIISVREIYFVSLSITRTGQTQTSYKNRLATKNSHGSNFKHFLN